MASQGFIVPGFRDSLSDCVVACYFRMPSAALTCSERGVDWRDIEALEFR